MRLTWRWRASLSILRGRVACGRPINAVQWAMIVRVSWSSSFLCWVRQWPAVRSVLVDHPVYAKKLCVQLAHTIRRAGGTYVGNWHSTVELVDSGANINFIDSPSRSKGLIHGRCRIRGFELLRRSNIMETARTTISRSSCMNPRKTWKATRLVYATMWRLGNRRRKILEKRLPQFHLVRIPWGFPGWASQCSQSNFGQVGQMSWVLPSNRFYIISDVKLSPLKWDIEIFVHTL